MREASGLLYLIETHTDRRTRCGTGLVLLATASLFGASGAWALEGDLSGGAGVQEPGGMPGHRPPPFVWVGTAKDGERTMPARMFLLPPPPPRGDQTGDGNTATPPVDGEQATADGTSGTTQRRPPRRPPGELRIGNRVLFIKPVSAEVDQSSGDQSSGGQESSTGSTANQPPRPPRLKKLTAELVRPPRRGAEPKDSGEMPTPEIIGTLEITVNPPEDGKAPTITGTARITDPDSGQEKVLQLEGTVMPPRPPGGRLLGGGMQAGGHQGRGSRAPLGKDSIPGEPQATSDDPESATAGF